MEINKGTVLVRPNKPIVFCSNDWNDGEDLKYSLGIEISKILKQHREFQKDKSLFNSRKGNVLIRSPESVTVIRTSFQRV